MRNKILDLFAIKFIENNFLSHGSFVKFGKQKLLL